MPGFFKASAIVCTGGAAIGAGILTILPPASTDPLLARSSFAIVRVSDLPPAPCKQQLWPNTDRGCQTWTVARHNVERLLTARPVGAVQQRTGADNTTIVARYPAAAATHAVADLSVDTDASDATASVASESPAPPIVERREEATAPKSASPSQPVAIAAWVAHGETAEEAKSRAIAAQDAGNSVVHVARATPVRTGIPVAAVSTGGTRRVIMIRPTSLQDELYYAARRYQAADNSAVTRR